MKEYQIQSVLNSAGPQAGRIESLWWLMFWVCAAVFVLVMVALAIAIARGRRGASVDVPESTLTRNIGISVGVSTVALIGLLFASVLTGRAIGSMPTPNPLQVRITGYQWWWSIEYQNNDPSLQVTTANELHLPVGRPVVITLQATDVIHSFWVPNLQGKRDLIPGDTHDAVAAGRRARCIPRAVRGVLRVQHAHMALTVVRSPIGAFESVAGRRSANPAPIRAHARTAGGRDVFMQAARARCATPSAARSPPAKPRPT